MSATNRYRDGIQMNSKNRVRHIGGNESYKIL
jgi:hypothetical protein